MTSGALKKTTNLITIFAYAYQGEYIRGTSK